MKKTLKLVLLSSSLTLLNACGAATEKSAESELSAESSGKEIHFNLGEFLSQSGASSSRYVKMSPAGMALGASTNFLVENNMLVDAANQKIDAQYYIDLTVLKMRIPGHVVDLTANAETGVLEAGVNFRVQGQSVYSMRKSSVMDYSFVRDVGVTVPYPILPALNLDLGGKVGGEIGFTVAPGIGADNRSVTVMFSPRAALQGQVTAGASLLFARAEAKGVMKLLDGQMPVEAGMGYTAANSPYGKLKVTPLNINVLAGRADLVASLGIGNILPSSARDFWNATFGHGPFGTYEYSYPLVAYEGIPVLETSEKIYQFGN